MLTLRLVVRMCSSLAALCLTGFVLGLGLADAVAVDNALATPPTTRIHLDSVPSTAAQKPLSWSLSTSSNSSSLSSYNLPLQTRARDIVDQDGRRIKLASVNWYGASDALFVPGGLDVRSRHDIAAAIRTLGFNSVRLPYSDELIVRNPHVLPHLITANPDLMGLRALDIYVAVVDSLTAAGLGVIVNNHITHATWCCGTDPCDAGWANDHLGPLCRVRQTEDDWIAHWRIVMSRLRHNPLVLGADLRNEVRGVWGTMPWARWAAAAERAGNTLLQLNPAWLIIVGGTESNNDLRGVTSRPVRLTVANRVVYTAHVYVWSGWGVPAGSYGDRDYASFAAEMHANWAYLLDNTSSSAKANVETSPVWVSEFGAPDRPAKGDENYWRHLVRFLHKWDVDWAYWAWNPWKPDGAKETYALVDTDWTTPLQDYRLRDLMGLMDGREEER